MIQWPLNNGTNQHWTFAFSNGYYTVENGASGFYLTDPNTPGETSAALTQQPLSANDAAQLWSITRSAGTGTATTYALRNKATGRVIADPGFATVKDTGIVVERRCGTGQRTRLRTFNQIIVIFLPEKEQSDSAPEIAIRQFVLDATLIPFRHRTDTNGF